MQDIGECSDCGGTTLVETATGKRGHETDEGRLLSVILEELYDVADDA